MKKNVVVFAPHPDDETLGCGGTIASLLCEGYHVTVVFITDGRFCLTDLGVTSEPTPIKIKEIRKEEALRATSILGLRKENLIFLDFEEKQLEKNSKQLQQKIVKILEDFSPTKVYYPQSKEYNFDHCMTNQIVKNAITLTKIHPEEYQYTIAWSFPFYLIWHILHEKTFGLISKFTHQKIVVSNVAKYSHLKERAIAEYSSQTSIIADDQKRPVLKKSFVNRFRKTEEKFFINHVS
jgi:LmbE family N-acetylglucosaminyl deacetylase